jgi:hypothetical protein
MKYNTIKYKSNTITNQISTNTIQSNKIAKTLNWASCHEAS